MTMNVRERMGMFHYNINGNMGDLAIGLGKVNIIQFMSPVLLSATCCIFLQENGQFNGPCRVLSSK